MPTFLIVDDHPMIRYGLRQVLAKRHPAARIEEAADAAVALDKIRQTAFSLVLLDIQMPGKSGLVALQEIKQVRPRMPVLVMSAHVGDDFAVRVLKAGAAGYIPKDSAPEEFVRAIERVMSGAHYITPAVAESMAGALAQGGSGQQPHTLLSDREYQVLCLMASGRTSSEIAKDFCLSVKTVSTYRTRILEKMKMKTNAELVHYAIKNGLVE